MVTPSLQTKRRTSSAAGPNTCTYFRMLSYIKFRRISLLFFFFLTRRRPPRSTLFPYTTLFRSRHRLTGDASNCRFQCPLHRRTVAIGLALEAVVIGAIILNTARDIHNLKLHESDLRNRGSIALAAPDLGDARIAAGTISVPRGQLLEHLLHHQLVGQCAQNRTAGVELDHHRLVRGLQSALGLIFVREDAQQFLATSLELIFKELAALVGQRGFHLLRAYLVRLNSLLQREATATGESQNLRGLLRIGNDRSQVPLSSGMALHCCIYQLFNLATDRSGACLGGLYAIIPDQASHEITPRRTATRLRHIHPVAGNSVPQLNPPFRGRRPYRLRQCWYAD